MKLIIDKKYADVFLLALFIALIYWNDKRQESKIEENKGVTYAKILGIKKGKGSFVQYKFFHNDKWYYDADSWNGKASKNEFYKVIFNKDNPEYSDIILAKNPISPFQLINEGIEIKGRIKRIEIPSKEYLDLYITYEFLNEKFEFRTRMNKDSLPCNIKNCEGSLIDMKISNIFPELNNLYYSSYDRSKIREKLNINYEK